MDLISLFTNLDISTSEKIFWSMWVSIGFAVLFTTPKRSMWVVAILGGLGFSCRTFLLYIWENQIVFASFMSACLVGILGIYCAHKVHTPPIVFTIPAIINIIPGKSGYEFMVSLIQAITLKEGEVLQINFLMGMLDKGIKTGFTLLSLAFGVVFPILIFKARSVKKTTLHSLLAKSKK
ncbi:threonine/serine exporter [Apibacter muscae]|uniref:threonine/serine exporter family protein n=1 Tax=Apibacter muscae TaxID=2509004 RepID=UPI0011AC77A3|nr:threonine/serine exporter family protein [Apibacter muscae]TWP24822.1 threonine/serine exporter [Apibacter muscae]